MPLLGLIIAICTENPESPGGFTCAQLVVPPFCHMIAISTFSSALSPYRGIFCCCRQQLHYCAEAIRRLPHQCPLIMPTLQLSAMSVLKLLMFRTLTALQGWLYLLELLVVFSITTNAVTPGLPLCTLSIPSKFQ